MIPKWIVVILVSIFGLTGLVSYNVAETIPSHSAGGSVLAFHFVLRRVSLERARWMVDVAHKAGINTIQVLITDGVHLDAAMWKPLSDAWSKTDLLSWVRYARNKGLEVIPEFKLLTHQEKLFQHTQPTLMFNAATYDPREQETYRRVFALLDEIIDAWHPKAIHIGHDELAGRSSKSRRKWLRPGDQMLPADLFLQDVIRLHDYLNQRGIKTWMWGDMLISPDEFPGMLARHLHGTPPGYGKPLRDKLPRDIVICDWHYFDDQPDFPSLSTMREEGFRVIGATWKKEKTIRNFSRYAARHGAYGMMATTWFHVQRQEWEVVENIIRTSGSVFSNHFLDTTPKAK